MTYEPLSDMSLDLLEAQALKELEEMNNRIYFHIDSTYQNRLLKFIDSLSNIPITILIYYYIHNKLPKEAYEYDVVMRVFCGWVLNNPETKEIVKQELLYRKSKMTFLEKAKLPVDLLLVK